MRRTSLLILLLLLVPAAPASAKEGSAAKICGPSACRDVDDHEALVALEGGNSVEPPGGQAPWYRAVITIRHEDARDEFQVVVVPSRGLIRSFDRIDGLYMWTQIPPAAAAAFRRESAGLEAYPASKLVGTGPPPDPIVQVDKVILPPDDPAADGGLGWVAVAGIAAAFSAAAAGAWLYIRRRWRRRGPLPRPGEAGTP